MAVQLAAWLVEVLPTNCLSNAFNRIFISGRRKGSGLETCVRGGGSGGGGCRRRRRQEGASGCGGRAVQRSPPPFIPRHPPPLSAASTRTRRT